jgi:hypothetical protein
VAWRLPPCLLAHASEKMMVVQRMGTLLKLQGYGDKARGDEACWAGATLTLLTPLRAESSRQVLHPSLGQLISGKRQCGRGWAQRPCHRPGEVGN